MAIDRIPQPDAAIVALDRLGRLSLRQLSMEALLQTVADLTSAAMPGDIEASVTLVVAGEPATVGYSGQLALDLDERQYASATGRACTPPAAAS